MTKDSVWTLTLNRVQIGIECIFLMKRGLDEWKMGFGSNDWLKDSIMSKKPFMLPPEFYRNLFASFDPSNANQQKAFQNDTNKLFNSQNFPRNLLFSYDGEDKEVENISLSHVNWTFLMLYGRSRSLKLFLTINLLLETFGCLQGTHTRFKRQQPEFEGEHRVISSDYREK